MTSAIRDVPERPVPATKTGEGKGIVSTVKLPVHCLRKPFCPRRDGNTRPPSGSPYTSAVFEYHGWVTLRSTAEAVDDDPPLRLDEIRELVDELTGHGLVDLRPVDGRVDRRMWWSAQPPSGASSARALTTCSQAGTGRRAAELMVSWCRSPRPSSAWIRMSNGSICTRPCTVNDPR